MFRIPATSPLRMTVLKCLPWAIWVGLLLVVSVRLLGGERRTVTDAYEQAAQHWMAGEPMYEMSGRGFLYFPQAAIVYAPFASVGDPWGDILWRFCGIALFGWSILRISRVMAPGDPEFHLGIVFVSALLCFSCLRNGQSTLPMTALMLLAAECIYQRRWNRAALCLALGFAVKPLVLVMLLLAAAVVPQLRVRLAVGLVLVLLTPFLLQNPAYVLEQYQDCFAMMRVAHDLGHQDWWAQTFGMLRTVGVHIAGSMQTGVRLAAALVTLCATVIVFRRSPEARRPVWLFTLSAVYLLLFNPRTENNTYCLLGPALGMFYAEELIAKNRRWHAGGLILLALLTLGSYELGKLMTPSGMPPVWLAPLACCAFAGYLGFRLVNESRATQAGNLSGENDLAQRPTTSQGHAA